MNEKLSVLTQINNNLFFHSIDNSIEAFQNFVEGYVEPVYFGIKKKFVLFADEEGKLKDKQVSLILQNESQLIFIVGKWFICRLKHNKFCSISDEDFHDLITSIKLNEILDVNVLNLNELG